MLQVTVTAKGQVTLRQAVLDHLGVKPGEKVGVSLLPDGKVELVRAAAGHELRSVRGLLRRRGQRAVSLQEMQDAHRSRPPMSVAVDTNGARPLPDLGQ